VNPRNVAGKHRVFGVRGQQDLVRRRNDFYEARNAMRSGERVVVSYDDGRTWYDLGTSPVSEDTRKR